MSNYTYLSAQQLSEKLPYSRRYISEVMKDRIFIQGVHYIQPFGRKVVFLWEPIEQLMLESEGVEVSKPGIAIPMARGGVCNG